jgi:hypothetical protein
MGRFKGHDTGTGRERLGVCTWIVVMLTLLYESVWMLHNNIFLAWKRIMSDI